LFFFSFAHKLSLGSFGHLSPFDRRAESRLIWHRTGRASPAKRTRLNSAPDVIGDGEARGSLLIISIGRATRRTAPHSFAPTGRITSLRDAEPGPLSRLVPF